MAVFQCIKCWDIAIQPIYDYIVFKLTPLYGPDDARDWLISKQPLLNDRLPIDLLEEGRHDQVLQALDQLVDGVYL